MKRTIFTALILLGVTVLSTAQTAVSESFRQEGIASWYGKEFAGRPTASGEIFNPDLYTAAHPTLPFGTVLTITNKQNMRQVTVRINDRGPFVAARIIDLSMASAEILDMIITGTAPVIVEPARDKTLGPVRLATAPVVTQPVTVPVVTPPITIPVVTPPVTVEPTPRVNNTEILPDPAIRNTTVPQESVPGIVNVPPPSQPAPIFFPAPAAVILGGIPPVESVKSYRLQVGAFIVPRNAINAYEKLKSAGLNPVCEQNGEFYRVVLAGLKAKEIQSVAQILGNTGFREALIKEETGN